MFLLNLLGIQRGQIILVFFLILTFTVFIIVNVHSSFSQVVNNNSLNCNCIVFRLDDIQDYFLNKSQIAIMDLFLEKNQSLSLALILNHLGNDTSIVTKVNIGHENGNFELDSHGWNHENFSKFSEPEQIELLNKANEKMLYLYGAKSPIFVPPFFEFNNLTLNAMSKTGMTIISSFDRIYAQRNQTHLITNFTHPNVGNYNKIIHFPSTVEYSFFEGKKWKTHPIEQVLGQIDRSISTYGYAVTTLHPQAFVPMQNEIMINTVNTTQLNTLEALLDSIRSRNIQIIDFNDLYQMRLNIHLAGDPSR